MKSRFSRRFFLRGAGTVAVGLPFLDSLHARSLQAQETGSIKRFACFFNCNGVQMDRFFPNASYGALSASAFSGRTTEPLAPFADRICWPRGIHMVPRGYNRDGGPGDDHAKGMGHKLTAEFLQETEDEYANGISVDQAIANAINPGDRQALTLKVGPDRGGVLGHVSYSAPGTPVSGENNPWLAYRDFMGLNSNDDEGPSVDDLRRRSVLDVVREDFEDLKRAPLSKADKDKLDMHFSTIRDLEGAIANAGMIGCNLDPALEAELEAIDPDAVGTDAAFPKMGKLQMDVLALALACDYTRSASLQWGSGAGGPIYGWDGMSHVYPHHPLSHGTTEDDGGGDVSGYQDMLAAIDTWHMEQLAYLLDRLDSYTEGEGTVLDNTVLLYTNELSDGKEHNFMDLPFFIVGGAGYFRRGEYIKVTDQENPKNDVDAPHNTLLTTCMNAVGATTEKFGGDLAPAGEMEQVKA